MAFWFAAFGAGEDAQLIIMRQDNTTNEENPKEVVSFNSKVMANKKVQQILPNKFFFFQLWQVQAADLESQRPLWTPGQLTVDGSTDFNVVMRGMATNGGFAIDDITFSNGGCPSKS